MFSDIGIENAPVTARYGTLSQRPQLNMRDGVWPECPRSHKLLIAN
jgi:hypothetical protein